MAEAISDRAVVGVLRPFVRASAPMLERLRDAEPFATRVGDADLDVDEATPGMRDKLFTALATVHVPGTAAWAQMDPAQRTDWWVNRVGRITALLAAVPGLGGVLADRLPVQDALGAAAQGLLLCAIAGEHGVTEVAEQVRLLAWVLFGRDVDRAVAAGDYTGHDPAAEDAETAELAGGLPEVGRRRKLTVKASARTLWRLGRSLWSITDELEKRPRGRFYHRAVGMLPVVGMAGNYLGERSGLRRVSRRAHRWLERN